MPRRLLHPRKRTVGVRIPDHAFVQALLDELGEPLLTSSLILPGETEPRTMGWEIKEELDHDVDIVVEAGETPAEPTTVVDWSEGAPEVCGSGAGDPDAGSWPEPVADSSVRSRCARWRAAERRQAQGVADDQRARCGGRGPETTACTSAVARRWRSPRAGRARAARRRPA